MGCTVLVARSASPAPSSIETRDDFAIEDGRIVVRADNSCSDRWLVQVGPEIVTPATGWKDLSDAVGHPGVLQHPLAWALWHSPRQG